MSHRRDAEINVRLPCMPRMQDEAQRGMREALSTSRQ